MLNYLYKLKNINKINDYLFNKVASKIKNLPNHLQKELIIEAIAMSKIGIKSDDDYKTFFYILQHIPLITKELSHNINEKDIYKISNIIFNNKDIYPIDTILNLYKSTSKVLNSLNIPLKKYAYPTGDIDYYTNPTYDTQKWLNTMKEIYYMVHNGYDFNKAFNELTYKWNDMEQENFKHWMNFYQEGAHRVYKKAQMQYIVDSQHGTPLLSVQDLEIPPNMDDIIQYKKDKHNKELDKKEKKEIIKSKIIGRLSSAEKLISSQEGIELLGGPNKTLEFLRILHDLKRQFQSSLACNMFEDLIIRKGNILINSGNKKAGEILISLAQQNLDPANLKIDKRPGDIKPGNLPSLLNISTNTSNTSESTPAATPPIPIKTQTELPQTKDTYTSQEAFNKLKENIKNTHDANPYIIVTSQAITQPPIDDDESIQVTNLPPKNKNVNKIRPEGDDSAFNLENITINDVIDKLNLVSNILKNREIPRQLSMIDLMMDKLGVATFFPTLGEATRSALESNQYMATRIEDILSKLRGTIESNEEIELIPDDIEGTLENLQKEQVAKPIRKPISTEELNQPINIQKTPATTVPAPQPHTMAPEVPSTIQPRTTPPRTTAPVPTTI